MRDAVDSLAGANGFSGVVRVDRSDDIELAKAYSNGGYVVLALIAERTSGIPFHELVLQRQGPTVISNTSSGAWPIAGLLEEWLVGGR